MLARWDHAANGRVTRSMTRPPVRSRTWIGHSDLRHFAMASSRTNPSARKVCRTRSAEAAGTGPSISPAASEPMRPVILQLRVRTITAFPCCAAPSARWGEGSDRVAALDAYLLRQIVPVHEARAARGLEHVGLLAFPRFMAQARGQRLLVLGTLLGGGEERVNSLDRRRCCGGRIITVADRLGRAGVEKLGPHL